MGNEYENLISNKELFELINDMRDRIEKTNRKQQDLRLEMEQTRSLIRKYNNLTSKMDSVQGQVGELEHKVTKMKAEDKGKIQSRKTFIEISGWLVAIGMAVYNIFF